MKGAGSPERLPAVGLVAADQHFEKADSDNNTKDGAPDRKTGGQCAGKLGRNAGYCVGVRNSHFRVLLMVFSMPCDCR